MTASSALYAGSVTHRRVRPRVHRLRYRAFWALFDLDELDALGRRLRLFSRNRFNLFSFRDRDYGSGTAEPLRTQIDQALAGAGIDVGGGPIRLLCMPRIIGYAFNPISIYFCYRRAGDLAAIIYEVNNTFGQRHSYLIPVATGGTDVIEQSCAKELYVSPFIPMALTYDFRVAPPAERVAVTVHGGDRDGLLISASLSGQRLAMSDANLLKLFFAVPLLTLKVTAGIHWEALKIWLKRVRLVERPPPPQHPITIVPIDKAESGHGF